MDLAQMQILAAGVVLAILWTLESAVAFMPGRKQRMRHNLLNVAIGGFNAGLLAVLFAPLLVQVTSWNESSGFGLFQWLELPVAAAALLAVLLQDAFMYAWHRANHTLPFLWRFHRVHHSDEEMDASTAVRFHTGEILISAVLRLGFVALLGLSLWQVLLYDLILVPVILFHHSNIRVPERLDQIFRFVFSSPAMHRVHHSPDRCEADSNYGSVFSFWDRVASSFRLPANPAAIRYGIDEFGAMKGQGLFALALMPFLRARSEQQARPCAGDTEAKILGENLSRLRGAAGRAQTEPAPRARKTSVSV